MLKTTEERLREIGVKAITDEQDEKFLDYCNIRGGKNMQTIIEMAMCVSNYEDRTANTLRTKVTGVSRPIYVEADLDRIVADKVIKKDRITYDSLVYLFKKALELCKGDAKSAGDFVKGKLKAMSYIYCNKVVDTVVLLYNEGTLEATLEAYKSLVSDEVTITSDWDKAFAEQVNEDPLKDLKEVQVEGVDTSKEYELFVYHRETPEATYFPLSLTERSINSVCFDGRKGQKINNAIYCHFETLGSNTKSDNIATWLRKGIEAVKASK